MMKKALPNISQSALFYLVIAPVSIIGLALYFTLLQNSKGRFRWYNFVYDLFCVTFLCYDLQLLKQV